NAEPGVSEISALENFTGPVVHTNGSAYISGLEFANLKVLVVGCRYSGIKMCLNLCTYNDLPHMVVRNSRLLIIKVHYHDYAENLIFRPKKQKEDYAELIWFN
ncbi:hypothetical protein HID58_045238, partial [Brassica napus]